MESGVCPVKKKKWGLLNCPETSLYLLCKNYNGVTIFKAYFSIHKKRHLFSVKWMMSPCCPLILNVCLNLFFFLILPHTHFLILWFFPAQVPSFVLWSFSHVNLYNGKYCSVWIESMENLKKKLKFRLKRFISV